LQLCSRLVRLRLGLETLFGLRRSGFFIPYGRAASVATYEHRSFPDLRILFDQERDHFARFINQIEDFGDELLSIRALEPPQPRFEQDWFPRLDAAGHYTMVRTLKPQRIIEIGSGHSTRWICRALADGNLTATVTAIDPQPRADIAKLPVKLERKLLQEIDFCLFDSIQPGDFVCMDSSHVFVPGSDVDVFINRILPRLPKGSFVFFHDIFLPDAYPGDWAPLGYSEQNAVAILLQGVFQLYFSSAYAVRYMPREVARSVISSIPLHPGGIENGLWLKKVH
jgi:predicted O-methyltransferase YrrM